MLYIIMMLTLHWFDYAVIIVPTDFVSNKRGAVQFTNIFLEDGVLFFLRSQSVEEGEGGRIILFGILILFICLFFDKGISK
jgi:hypothetical protein